MRLLLDRANCSAGDRAVISVEVRGQRLADLVVDDEPLSILQPGLCVRPLGQGRLEGGPAFVTWTQQYEALMWRAGEYRLPPVRVRIEETGLECATTEHTISVTTQAHPGSRFWVDFPPGLERAFVGQWLEVCLGIEIPLAAALEPAELCLGNLAVQGLFDWRACDGDPPEGISIVVTGADGIVPASPRRILASRERFSDAERFEARLRVQVKPRAASSSWPDGREFLLLGHARPSLPGEQETPLVLALEGWPVFCDSIPLDQAPASFRGAVGEFECEGGIVDPGLGSHPILLGLVIRGSALSKDMLPDVTAWLGERLSGTRARFDDDGWRATLIVTEVPDTALEWSWFDPRATQFRTHRFQFKSAPGGTGSRAILWRWLLVPSGVLVAGWLIVRPRRGRSSGAERRPRSVDCTGLIRAARSPDDLSVVLQEVLRIARSTATHGGADAVGRRDAELEEYHRRLDAARFGGSAESLESLKERAEVLVARWLSAQG